MPFDGTDKLNLPVTMAELPALLRDRSRWPADFEWNYGRPETCAVGLVAELAQPKLDAASDFFDIIKALGFSYVEGRIIFSFQHKCTTPETIARMIELHMARVPA